ncbi:hypothetical protein C2G38_2064978 [Gigaspora rosea]|uniref:Ribonuclease H n=1 Tax=Gigaspora rosea TaxID=44941 RepID=A0A397VWS1_9GLOM|nr:hypothetical protein C2G38_2064978 [Gigaspora rosea]
MPKTKPGYYAVKIGRQPGIYLTWDECLAQVKGFSGSKYKKFYQPNLLKPSLTAKNHERLKMTKIQTNCESGLMEVLLGMEVSLREQESVCFGVTMILEIYLKDYLETRQIIELRFTQ